MNCKALISPILFRSSISVCITCLFLPGLIRAQSAGSGDAKTNAVSASQKRRPMPMPKYILKVLVVRTCNDDGTNCSTASLAQVQAGLEATNEVHLRSKSGIKFVIDPQTDFNNFINRTNLNTDCIIPAGTVPEQVTVQDVNKDGKIDSEDSKLICDPTLPAAERTAFALQYPHSVVAFARGLARGPAWDKAAGHWTISIPSGGFSSCAGEYVAVRKDFGGGTFFAHESGHYLCTPHTFGSQPADVAGAATIIRNYVEGNNINRNDPAAVLSVFDADPPAKVYDTPPDPGPGIFQALYGDPCSPSQGSVSVPVKFSDNTTKTYVLAPARDNVMSYFKSCPAPAFLQHFSPDQVKQHLATLAGRRHALLEGEPTPCYASNGLRSGASGASLMDLIKYRAEIIAKCVKLTRKPRPGEIYMDQIYSNPASMLKKSLQEIEVDRLGQQKQ